VPPGGAGGDITVTATGPVTITGDSSGIVSLGLSSEPTANGGAVTVSAQSLTVADLASIGTTALGPATGGKVAISVGDLSVTGGATISSTTFQGQGGDVSVTATGSAVISGAGSAISSGGSAASTSIAPAGNIAVNAGTLTVADSGVIQNGTTLDVAGNIAVTATNAIVLRNGGAILSQAFTNSVGDVTISAPSLTLDNGLIQTSTIQEGNAGNITANVGTLTLTGGGQILASSALSATGAGGSIKITANDVFASGQSRIDSSTNGTGAGGDINITAGDVQLQSGSTISANSTGSAQALAGSINIVFGNELSMNGGSAITTSSLLADGGNISITSTGSTLILFDSQIITSVQSGVGQGGNITLGSALHPLSFLIMSDSQIRADAFGGPGGNIQIFADTFLSSGAVLSASSALSAPGTIDVQTQFTDLSSALVQLPVNVLEATALLRASCATRLAEGKASSLVVAGREGVPPEPDGLLSSPLVLEGLTEKERTAAEEPGEAAPLLTLRWPTAVGETCR
jgi:large exoprotein involved in heme utilization and adhesion